MSINVMVWAFEQKGISSTEKFVLVSLSNFANQDNECYPSQKTLGEMTNLSERAVRKVLASLEQKGLILRTPRRLKGVPTSDWYKIAAPISDVLPRKVTPGNYRPIPFETAKLVYERDEYRCQKCGTFSNLSLDHVHPRRLDGSNDPSNLQVLCRSCNSIKGASATGFNRKGNPLPARGAATLRNDMPQVPERRAADPKSDPSIDPRDDLSEEEQRKNLTLLRNVIDKIGKRSA